MNIFYFYVADDIWSIGILAFNLNNQNVMKEDKKRNIIAGLVIGLILVVVGFAPSHAFAQEGSDASAEESDLNVEVDGGELVDVVTTQSQGLVLYVQEGCGHCAKVEAFIETNDLAGEIEIKDVSADPGASEEYTAFFDAAGVPLEERGVPLLVYGGSEYLTGDAPIIDYLKEQFGIVDEKKTYSGSEIALLAGGTVFIGAILGYGIVKVVNGRKTE